MSLQRVQIVTVDPATRYVEFRLKDQVVVSTQVWEVPSFFRWPKQGEYWTVERMGNTWKLGDRMEARDSAFPVTRVAEGEAKVNAERVIYTDDGARLAAVVGTPTEDDTLSWDAAQNAWVPTPSLRGVNVPATGTSLTVTFPTAQPNTAYGILLAPSWSASAYVTKTISGFTIHYGTAPGGATIDWLLIR